MAPSLAELARIIATAPEVEREDLRQYLSSIRDVTVGLHRQTRRSIASIVGLTALFMLLTSGGLSEVEVFGVKAAKFTLFLLAIPVAVAFLYVQAAGSAKGSILYGVVYEEIAGLVYPTWKVSLLSALPLGQVSAIGLPRYEHFFFKPGIGKSLASLGGVIDLVSATLLTFAFPIYAFITLFSTPEVPVLGAVLSMALTSILTIYGVLLVGIAQPID